MTLERAMSEARVAERISIAGRDGCGGRCLDFDEDCFDIGEVMPGGFLGCWMYDPAKGYCPFLTGEEPK